MNLIKQLSDTHSDVSDVCCFALQLLYSAEHIKHQHSAYITV